MATVRAEYEKAEHEHPGLRPRVDIVWTNMRADSELYIRNKMRAIREVTGAARLSL